MRSKAEESAYQVLRNDDGLLTLWPAGAAALPPGWRGTGMTGTAEACFEDIAGRWSVKTGSTTRDTPFSPLIDANGHCAVWPSDAQFPVPAGWDITGRPDTLDALFERFEATWGERWFAVHPPAADDHERYHVIAESPSGIYAIWPVRLPVPQGFHLVAKEGTRAECEAMARMLWAEVFPAAARVSPAHLEAQAADTVARRFETAAETAAMDRLVEQLADRCLQHLNHRWQTEMQAHVAAYAEALRRVRDGRDAELGRMHDARPAAMEAEAERRRLEAAVPQEVTHQVLDGPLTGEIKLFAGQYAPAGWALCDGRMLAIQDYPALFSVIGTQFGGDGQRQFALPDLRGRAPVQAGQGPGLPARAIGQLTGDDLITPGADTAHAVRTTAELTLNFIIALNGVYPTP